MVRVNRSKEIPQRLTNEGITATNQNIAAYQANFEVEFSFDSSIYGHQSVKTVLRNFQNDKCCFCESKVSHISHGDVEHFRPKGGYKQQDDDELQTPGYFWLAYEWRNLLFCCQICNQRHKKNLFPLLNPGNRALTPDANIADEQPLFINPADPLDAPPEQLIGFRGDTPYAIDGNPRGEETIKALGLKRELLRERRYALLEKLKFVFLVARQIPATPYSQNAQLLLDRAQMPEEEYSAAVRCAINDQFQFV